MKKRTRCLPPRRFIRSAIVGVGLVAGEQQRVLAVAQQPPPAEPLVVGLHDRHPRDTGKLATPNCPRTMSESFITGTEPVEICPLHSW